MHYAPLLALILVMLFMGVWFIVPEYRYLSSRNRRAMRLSLLEFKRTHESKPRRAGCHIYKTDAQQCVVMIPETSQSQPPITSFYAVPHDSNRVDFLGSGQCHWGLQPEDVLRISRVEKCYFPEGGFVTESVVTEHEPSKYSAEIDAVTVQRKAFYPPSRSAAEDGG